MKYELYIGVDTGVHTGLAVWDADKRELSLVCTKKIHEAMSLVKILAESRRTLVRVEDARKRKWFGDTGRERLKGAGSVERDAKIWEDFLSDLKIACELVAPKNNRTKLDAASFAKLTGFPERTSEHARDAAMMVYGY